MSLFCEVCRINVQSETVMKEHCQGKRHKRNQVLYDRRKDLADRSVFTRGFPPKTEEATLKEYFSQFGEVQRVLQDRDKGVYAIIEYTEGSAIPKIFSQKNHVISGHKIVVKPREFKPPVVKPPDPGAPIPQRRPVIAQSPECKARETAELLKEFNFRVDCLPEPENLRRVLQSCDRVEGQMKVLCEELELEEDDIKARQKIVSTLQELFIQFFAGCELHTFGSSANGFGTKGCDMDLFLDLKTEERLVEEEKSGSPQKPQHIIKLSFCNCPKCKDNVKPKYTLLRCGGIKSLDGKEFPVSAKSLSDVTLYDKVKLLSRILSQFHLGCSDAHTIPSIRCPVVRFCHAPTGIKCDLSVNNRLALQNTRLLRYYCQLDPRVRPLVFSLRYWGKLKEVSTNPVSGPRLTNYALSLLVIFFLQNTQPPVLPTVTQLAVSQEEEPKIVVDGWDCSFQEIKPEGKELNTATAEELLIQFFLFYCGIDFSNVVLCSRSGRLVPVSEFYGDLGKKDRAQHFKTGPISIQDPFVLDHNVALNVNDKVRLKLVDELNIAREICGKFGQVGGDKTELWGLLLLFDSPPEGTGSQLNTSGSLPDGDPNSKVFRLVLKMSQMSEIMVKYLHRSADYRVEWVLTVCRFLEMALSDILLFDCQVLCDRRAELTESVCSQAMNSVNLQTDSAVTTTTAECTGKSGEDETDSLREASSSGRTSDKPSGCESVPEHSSQDTAGKESHGSVRTSKRLPDNATSPRVDNVKRCRKEEENVPESVKRCKNEANMNTHQENPVQENQRAVCVDTAEKSLLQGQSSQSLVSNPPTSVAAKGQGGHKLSCGAAQLPCLQLKCISVYRAWNGRKTVRRKLIGEGSPDCLETEKRVTEELRKADAPAKKPVLECTCEVQAVIEPGKTETLVTFKPGVFGTKEFTCFYPFAKTYLIKAVDKYLAESVPELNS